MDNCNYQIPASREAARPPHIKGDGQQRARFCLMVHPHAEPYRNIQTRAPQSQGPDLVHGVYCKISNAQTHMSFCRAAARGASVRVSRTVLVFSIFPERREEMLQMSLFFREALEQKACWWAGKRILKISGMVKRNKAKTRGNNHNMECYDVSARLLCNRHYWGFFLAEADLDNTGVITNYCSFFLCCG